MNQIQQFINQMCPNGVEWKTLGEVCEILDSQRKPVSKSNRIRGQYPYYGANGIQDYVDNYLFDGSFLLVGEDGSVIKPDKSPIVHWAIGKIWVNNHAHILAEKANVASLRYLFYSLQCVDVSDIVRGVPPKINQENLKNIQIPVPPLAIQTRIVEILDHFTNLTANLTAELNLRRKQFEHYREKLLSLDGVEGVEWKTLGEVFETRNGYTPSTNNQEFWDDGTIPWFKMEDIRENGRILSDSINHITAKAIKGKGLFKANSVILATSATIGEHALITVEHLSNQRFTNFYPQKEYIQKLDMKFVYYYFYIIDSWCKEHTVQGNFAGVNMTELYNCTIPVPPLATQHSIVSILDKFTALIENIEKELALRQKQYEYYREELLRFGG